MPRPLASLLAAGLVLSVAWSLATASLQGPDEYNHAAYVQHLAETGTGPHWGAVRSGGTWSTEQYELMRWQDLLTLIGLVGARPGWTPVEQARWNAISDRLGASARRDGDGPNPTAQNPPLYYAWEAIPYRVSLFAGLPTRLLVMRLWNIPLYLAVIAFAWLAAGELLGRRRWLQTVAAGAVALLPQLSFMSGVVNPDILLAAIWAAFVYSALVVLRVGARPRLLVALGGLAAAAALTHARGLSMLGPLLVTLLVVGWRALPGARRAVGWLAGSLGLALVGAASALAYSHLFGGGASIGDEAGSTTGAGTLRGFLSYLWQFYLPPLGTMAHSGPPYGYRQAYIQGLGGTFGSLEVTFPAGVYDALQVAAAVGLVLLVLAVTRRWERVRAHAGQLLVLASIPVAVLGVLHAAGYRNLQSPPYDPLIVGRYLLPMAVLFGLAVAFVCASLPRRAGAALGAAVLVAFTLLCVAGIGLTVGRFYA